MRQVAVRAGAVTAAALLAVTALWLLRAADARSLPELAPWHTLAMAGEFSAQDYPDGISWREYQALEARLAQELDERLYGPLPVDFHGALNRFDKASRVYPGPDGRHWNWSFELPVAAPAGGILLIHGASDSPYSFRALAARFHAAGLHVLALRLPGNGTLPQGLARVRLEDWTAVTEAGARHLHEQLGDDLPIYVAGYSIGAPLVLDYTLRSLDDPHLRTPDAVLLYSPAIAVSRYARFAKWDVLLSRVPGFGKFAWLTVQPEYDPYKYNSFAKNAGILSYRLTNSVQEALQKVGQRGDAAGMPPVLAFQSVVDATVSTDAVVNNMFRHLPVNGSELVLFDMNRIHLLRHMLIDSPSAALDSLFAGPPHRFGVTLVSNRSAETVAVAATTRPAGKSGETTIDLPYRWPDGVYSLSHVAIPFEPADPWYGAGVAGDAGAPLTLGTVAPRGEKAVLAAEVQNLMRLRYNPFFNYVAERSLAFLELQATATPRTGDDRT